MLDDDDLVRIKRLEIVHNVLHRVFKHIDFFTEVYRIRDPFLGKGFGVLKEFLAIHGINLTRTCQRFKF